jgi:oxepin-CoA hydrolase/3-oxo-5,6-dehydrosuberyl-CoA semialdehyde dehydrogenase
VRLTCKEKVDRQQKGKELPSGIVKWYVEIFDTNLSKKKYREEDEEPLVAIATILTMVQKKQTQFTEITDEVFEQAMLSLTQDAKPNWGKMTSQHMLEHLELSYRISSGEIQGFTVSTPEEEREELQEFLWNYKPMPKNFNSPLYGDGELPSLKHDDLAEAKQKLREAKEKYERYFQENPEAENAHAVYGELTGFEWKLLHRKHLNHHFEQFGILVEA